MTRGRRCGVIVAVAVLAATMAFDGTSVAAPDTTAPLAAPTADELVTTVTTDPASGETVAPGAPSRSPSACRTPPSTDLPAGTSVTSDLTAVAPLVTLPDEATLAAAGVSVTKTADKDTLTWTVPAVAAGETASTKLKLTVGVEAGGKSLAIAAAPAGSECAAEACKTELSVAKAETVETTWTSEPTTAAETSKSAESTDPSESSAEPTESTVGSVDLEPPRRRTDRPPSPATSPAATVDRASTAESSTAPITENGGSSSSAPSLPADVEQPGDEQPRASTEKPARPGRVRRPGLDARRPTLGPDRPASWCRRPPATTR